MHAARLDRSKRLLRVHALLKDGAEHSTLDIVQGAGVCAVNSCVAELRANGAVITCRQSAAPHDGERIWLYRMLAPVPTASRDGARLLEALRLRGGHTTRELADATGVTTAAAGRLLDRLERASKVFSVLIIQRRVTRLWWLTGVAA